MEQPTPFDSPDGRAEPADARLPATLALASVTLLGLLTRVGWFLLGPKVIENEGVYYARVAENLASGRGYVSVHELGKHLINPPLYAWLISLGVRAGGNAETVGRLLSVVCGVLLPPLVFLFARRLYDARAAWCAGLLAAVHPVLIVISSSVLTESLYLLLSLGGLWCVTELQSLRSWRLAVAGGVLLGLAYLSRPEAMILIAVFAAAIVIVNRDRWRLALGRAAVLLGVFAIFAVPYVHFLYRETGQLRFEAKTADGVRYAQRQAKGQSWGEIYFAIDKNTLKETGATNTSDLEMVRDTQATLGERLRMFARQGARNLPRLLEGLSGIQLGQPALGICVVLGLAGVGWDRQRLRRDLFLVLSSAVTLATFATWPFFHDRYLFPLLPAMAIWGGVGLDRLGRWARESAGGVGLGARVAGFAAPAVGAACVFLLCVAGANGVRESDEIDQSWMVPSYQDDIAIGRWIRQQGGTRPRIMDTGPLVPFYGDGVLVPYPWADAQTALRYIDHRDVGYLIVREVDGHRRPYLADWFQKVPDERFELVKTFDAPSGVARVYRWRGDLARR